MLSARGYPSVVFFCDSIIASPKMIKEDSEDDNLEAVVEVVIKHIKKYSLVVAYNRRTNPTKISKEIAEESEPDNLPLLRKLSIGEQSLPSFFLETSLLVPSKLLYPSQNFRRNVLY